MGASRTLRLAGLSLAVAMGASAQSEGSLPATHVLLVTGLSGAPEYAELFRSQAETFRDAALGRWGLPEDRFVWLAERRDVAPGVAGVARRETVERELGALAERAGPDDAILIVLLGHGSSADGVSKLNLPGPDLSGRDLDAWLSAFPRQTVAVVNAASASGGFLADVAGEGRIVVTATRTPREREWTHFGTFFLDAYAQPGADADKDERVSLLEAFLYAKREVERYYERGGQMQTEHALLDDDGDGEGSADPAPAGPDGSLASRFFLAAAPAAVAERAADDPELAGLLAEKARLESEIAALRARRDELEPGRYEAALEALLLDLALTSREIRERGGA